MNSSTSTMESEQKLLKCLMILATFISVIGATTWPSDSTQACAQPTKQKAMYGQMTWSPSLAKKPFTSFEVVTEWNDLQFNPKSNPHKNGGVYISYTTGVKDGPNGYFGVQIKADGGQFLFSFWDMDRFIGTGHNKKPKKASKLVWPAYMKNCKRNCQDCGIVELRQWEQLGLTTGTQCFLKYDPMEVGDKYRIQLKQRKTQGSLNTKSYGGMPKAHQILGETDKNIVGGIWDVIAYDLQRGNKRIVVGSIIMEGDGAGMDQLGTFDEMLGCNKCNAVHHKDTRYGPKLGAADRSLRRPTKMTGLTKAGESTCKKYSITGSKDDLSITFEGGPFTSGSFPYDGNKYQLVWA